MGTQPRRRDAEPEKDTAEITTSAVIAGGDITVIGRITTASNATLVCHCELDGKRVRVVYKPVRGERPLWDFPDGTLAGREVASYLVSEALGWNVIPLTVLRDGPFGVGMVQAWVDTVQAQTPNHAQNRLSGRIDLVDLCPVDDVPSGVLRVLDAYDDTGAEVTLVHADDPRLNRMAVLDILINNADRKGGHVLEGIDGRVYGIDHGICLNVDHKLRTVLWGWAGKPVDDALLYDITGLVERLGGFLGEQLCEHITPNEVQALIERCTGLVEEPAMPFPRRGHPIPWPAF